MLGQPAWLLASLFEAVLAERGKFAVGEHELYEIVRHYGDTSPELVWSGNLGSPTARMTRWVIEDLFRSATCSSSSSIGPTSSPQTAFRSRTCASSSTRG